MIVTGPDGNLLAIALTADIAAELTEVCRRDGYEVHAGEVPQEIRS